MAKQLGLSEVRAGLHPEDKVAAIREFTQQGRKVANNNRHPVGTREWPAMLRLVERVAPDYKQ